MDFATNKNFEQAFQRIKASPRSEYKQYLYDSMYTFEMNLDKNISTLVQKIKENIYRPITSSKIYFPKKNYGIRPITIPSFIDHLVYQAIVDHILERTYNTIKASYSDFVYGNIPNNPNDGTVFMYKQWSKSFKKFKSKQLAYIDNKYEWVSDFDLSSFFDTINHSLLKNLLFDKYKIDVATIDLLLKILITWSADTENINSRVAAGIPQGPNPSFFLADLVLFELDKEVIRLKSKYQFEYIRYVDDIKLFCLDEFTCKKLTIALDLYSRNLGFVPQSAKVKVQKTTRQEFLQNNIGENFSNIKDEYIKEGNKLKTKTNNKLTKKLIEALSENHKNYLNKTIINFSLFKINKSDIVRDLIIRNFSNLTPFANGILYYLQKHHNTDSNVLNFISNILQNESLYLYEKAIAFSHFKDLPFDEKIYIKILKSNQSWNIKYHIIDWLFTHKSNELIIAFILDKHENQLVRLKALKTYIVYCESQSLRRQLRNFLYFLVFDKDDLISLCSMSHLRIYQRFIDIDFVDNQPSLFTRNIVNYYNEDIITITLRENSIYNLDFFDIVTPDKNSDKYGELKTLFYDAFIAYRSRESNAIVDLNNFNELLLLLIFNILKLTPGDKYGNNVQRAEFKDKFESVSELWAEINEKRNTSSAAHIHDKSGNIRKRISGRDYAAYLEREIDALRVLCNHNWSIYY